MIDEYGQPYGSEIFSDSLKECNDRIGLAYLDITVKTINATLFETRSKANN